MKNLTSIIKTMRRLRNWLVVALWLAIISQIQAANVSIVSYTPTAVSPEYAVVTVTVDFDDVGVQGQEFNEVLSITMSGGDFEGGNCQTTEVYPCAHTTWLFYFVVSQITTDLDINFSFSGTPVTAHIPCAKITGLEARMHQTDTDPLIDEANYDQDIFFKAILNPVALVAGITFADLTWGGGLITPIAGGPWAQLTDPTSGHPTISAQLGSVIMTKDVWKVKLTVQSAILAGATFREIRLDPTSGQPSTAVFGGTIPDPNNPTGPGIQLPHWTTGSTALPVLYQKGALVGIKPTFTFEPGDYSGAVHLQGSGTIAFSDAPDSHSAGDYVWQAQELTASAALPNDVGHNVYETAWQFYVGQSVPSDAGTSHYDIYRALSASGTDYITVVEIACDSVAGTDTATAFTGIWGKFQTRSVCKYGSGTMTYFYLGTAAPPNYNKEALISSQDGKCGAWADLFCSALEIHGLHPVAERIIPTVPIWISNVNPIPPLLLYTGKALKLKSSLLGQGGTGIPSDLLFLDHVGVQLGGVGTYYDPSFGESYGTPTGTAAENYIAFEDGVVESQYCEMVDNGYVYWEFVPNQPGTRETKISVLYYIP